jgi:hypothetical protein
MAWYSSERGSLDTPHREPRLEVSLSSQERIAVSEFVSSELAAYLVGELEPTVWREDMLRGLWRKLNAGKEWGWR